MRDEIEKIAGGSSSSLVEDGGRRGDSSRGDAAVAADSTVFYSGSISARSSCSSSSSSLVSESHCMALARRANSGISDEMVQREAWLRYCGQFARRRLASRSNGVVLSSTSSNSSSSCGVAFFDDPYGCLALAEAVGGPQKLEKLLRAWFGDGFGEGMVERASLL